MCETTTPCTTENRVLTVAGDEDGHDETVNLDPRVSERIAVAGKIALTAMIPAMITGITHLIMRSGRRTDMAEIPTPDLAVL